MSCQAGAGDIVHQGMIAMEFVSSIEDLQLMTFAHPTISEAVHEAVLSADGRAIHAIQRKRKQFSIISLCVNSLDKGR